MSMEKIIANLKEQISNAKKYKNGMDEASWGYEQGVLITPNEAKKLILLYEFYKGVMNTHGIENNKDICKLSKKLI